MCFEKAVKARPIDSRYESSILYEDLIMDFVTCIECGHEVASHLAVKDDQYIFCSTDCLASCVGFTYVDGNGYKPDDELLSKLLLAGM